MSIKQNHRNLVLSSFFDVTSQAALYALFYAFPKSRVRFNNEGFKKEIHALFSKVLTGIEVANQSYKNWNLDMGAGNVLKSSKSAATLGARSVLVPGMEKNTRTRRINLPIRYSPLMSNYLKQKNYEAQNAIKNWEMRFTIRNEARE